MAAVPEGHYEMNGYLFGGSTVGPVFVESYLISAATWTTQDGDSPTSGRTHFGRDVLGGPTWTFELNIVAGTTAAALEVLGQLMQVWRNAAGAATPGAESVLRYTRGGRTRRVYGRPRNLVYDPNRTLTREGVLRVTAEFETSDAYHYNDLEEAVEVRLLAPASVGGAVFPVVFPIITEPAGDRQGQIVNTGTAPTPASVQFFGPVTTPKIKTARWELGLNLTLAYDQSVTIDTRDETVRRNDGVYLPGTLGRLSRYDSAKIDPGPSEFVFSGIDPTGSARAKVLWRPTHNGL